MSFSIDRSQELKLLAAYTPEQVDKVLRIAAQSGSRDAAKVLRGAAPVGNSARLSQYYRRMGLGHGTFRASVKAAKIRARGAIGYVVGPVGRNAFVRHWIELGTTHSRANPWVERSATEVLSVAQRGSEAVLSLYSGEH